jgi:hypothetical protein
MSKPFPEMNLPYTDAEWDMLNQMLAETNPTRYDAKIHAPFENLSEWLFKRDNNLYHAWWGVLTTPLKRIPLVPTKNDLIKTTVSWRYRIGK